MAAAQFGHEQSLFNLRSRSGRRRVIQLGRLREQDEEAAVAAGRLKVDISFLVLSLSLLPFIQIVAAA